MFCLDDVEKYTLLVTYNNFTRILKFKKLSNNVSYGLKTDVL